MWEPRICLFLLASSIAGPCFAQNGPEPERTEVREARRAEDYDAHVAALRKKLPHDGFHVVVQPPFVVIGDQDERSVQRWAKPACQVVASSLRKSRFTEP